MIAANARTWKLQVSDTFVCRDLAASLETGTERLDTRHDPTRIDIQHEGGLTAAVHISLGAWVLDLDLAVESAHAVVITCAITNIAARDQRLRSVQPLRYIGDWGATGIFTRSARDHVHTVPFERHYGFDGVHPLDRNAPAVSHWFAAVSGADSPTVTMALHGVPQGIVRWQLTPLQSHTAGMRVLQWSCDIDTMSGMRGVRIPAGATLPLGAVRLALETLPPDEALRTAARRCAAAAAVTLPGHPPTGWCSWYFAGTAVTDDLVRATLDAMDAHPALGVVQIDDGWMRPPGTRTLGPPLVDERKFPRGLAAVARDITGRGRKPGLWLRPFEGWPDAPGTPAWARGTCIDLSHPDALAWLRGLARYVTHAWGFRYLKLDFLAFDLYQSWGMELTGTHGARLQPSDDTRTNARLVRDGLAALRDGAGEAVFLAGCNVPLGCGIGLVDGMRIGDDVDAANDDRTRTMGMGAIDALEWMNGVLWWNDPDCILVHDPIEPAFARAWARRVIDARGAVMIGSPLDDPDPQRRILLADILRAIASQ